MVDSERQHFLGSSDAAAICGLDPWRSSADVWAEKTGRVIERPLTGRRFSSPVMLLGQYLEPAILRWVSDKTGLEFAPGVTVLHPNGICRATLDGVKPQQAVVEAKTSGLMVRPRFFDDFGEEGSDQLPQHILAQVHHQLGIVNAVDEYRPIKLAYVPALLVQRGFVLYVVNYDAEISGEILNCEEEFWRDYVSTQEPPPDTPTLAVLKNLRRQPEVVAQIDGSVMEEWLSAREVRLQAEKIEEECERMLLGQLGEAEVGECEIGRITYYEVTRKPYEVPESRFRRLLFRKPDKGKERKRAAIE